MRGLGILQPTCAMEYPASRFAISMVITQKPESLLFVHTHARVPAHTRAHTHIYQLPRQETWCKS